MYVKIKETDKDSVEIRHDDCPCTKIVQRFREWSISYVKDRAASPSKEIDKHKDEGLLMDDQLLRVVGIGTYDPSDFEKINIIDVKIAHGKQGGKNLCNSPYPKKGPLPIELNNLLPLAYPLSSDNSLAFIPTVQRTVPAEQKA